MTIARRATVTTTSERHPVHAVGLRKLRGTRTLWADVDFTVTSGSALAITGPSGAGKSTLLNCIGLLETPDSGSLTLDGISTDRITGPARRALFRHTIGHLFQNYGLVESWSVDGNLDIAFTGRRTTRRERKDQREVALDRVGLADLASRPVYSLSGGEQQRVALARLLLKQPLVIVADEPSAALDEANVATVLSVLGELRDGGCAVVVATHDDVVTRWCGDHVELGGEADRDASGAS